MKSKSLLKATAQKSAVRFGFPSVRRYGSKQELVGFPEIPPRFPESYRLIALLGGMNWGYGIDVTAPADYAMLLGQVKSCGSNIESVELYSLHIDFLKECAL